MSPNTAIQGSMKPLMILLIPITINTDDTINHSRRKMKILEKTIIAAKGNQEYINKQQDADSLAKTILGTRYNTRIF